MKKIINTLVLALMFSGLFTFTTNTYAVVSMAISSVSVSPSTVDFSIKPSVGISYHTNTEGYVTLEIFKGSSKVGTFIDNQYMGIGGHTFYWNGKYGSGTEIGEYGETVENGTYKVTITGVGTNQTEASGQETFTVSSSSTTANDVSIVDDGVDKDSFDPWKSQSVKISFEIDADAKVTVKILNKNGGLIKTLKNSENYDEGSHSVTWNGKNSSGNIVAEGDYKYSINAVAGLKQDTVEGEIVVEKGAVSTSSSSAPDIVNAYVTKNDFDPEIEYTYIVFSLTKKADIEVSIYDNNDDLLETLYDEKNQDDDIYKIKWDGGGETSGNFTYKISVENDKGKDSFEDDIEIEEDESDEQGASNIYRDQIDIDDIPYASKSGNLNIAFKLEKDAEEVKVEIRQAGKTIDTVFDEEDVDKGSHSVNWDGKNKSGQTVAGGVYEYRITSNDSGKEDTERGYFLVSGSTSTTGGSSDKCGDFKDVYSTYKFCDAIIWAKGEGIFTGYPDGSFKPYQSIRRSEILKVVIEDFDITQVGTNGGNLGFKDINGYEWFMNYLSTGMAKGLIQGYGDKTLRPYEPVNRAQAFKIMLEGAKNKFGLSIPNNTFGQPYIDVPAGKWYTKYAWIAQNNDLTDNEDYFFPLMPMTRGEMADVLYRFDQAGLSQ